MARRMRRSWADEEKRRIVEETLLPGASVAAVAQRHDINANLLFSWRRQAHVGSRVGGERVPATAEPAEFVPIGVFGRAADEGPAMVTINAPAAYLAGLPGASNGRCRGGSVWASISRSAGFLFQADPHVMLALA